MTDKLNNEKATRYSKDDSKAQITNVTIPKKITWLSMLLKPRDATKLFSFSTTRSTATPIKTSGAISKTLFRTEQIEANQAFFLQGWM